MPATPASGDGVIGAVVRRLRTQDLATHLRRMLAVAALVTAAGGAVTLYLAKVGIDRCSEVDGETVCRQLRWHPLSVQLRSDITVKGGVPHGQRTEWHPNGVVSIHGSYDEGVKVGPWVEFYRSGRPMFEGTYARGVRTGLETWWYENGAREWEVRHERGRRHGIERWWFPSGVLRREGAYARGDKDGVFIVYNEDGAEAFRARYQDGVAVAGDS